jgi:hypothetical protein
VTGARARLVWLGLYAIAMALIEAAVVVHLRQIYYSDDLRAIFPLRGLSDADLALEFGRELATVVMILAVAWVAESDWRRRAAAFLFVFGLWDLFYYVWLKLAIGWPTQWLEWDVLFLVPWPWLAPWIAAAAIALLFIVWATLFLAAPRTPRLGRVVIIVFVAGVLIDLMAFLQAGWALLPGGRQAFDGYAPGVFLWPAFLIGWSMMAVALARSLLPRNARAIQPDATP